MAVCSEHREILDGAFSMKCKLCDGATDAEENMVCCLQCKKYLCTDCVNQWSFQQHQQDATPSCPFCREDLPLFKMYNKIYDKGVQMLQTEIDTSSFFGYTSCVDLPPVSWSAYFNMLGWNTACASPHSEFEYPILGEDSHSEFEDVGFEDFEFEEQWMNGVGLIDELTPSDEEYVRYQTPAEIRRSTRLEIRRNRRSTRIPRRVVHLLDPVSF